MPVSDQHRRSWKAVDEYAERHREEFAARIERAGRRGKCVRRRAAGECPEVDVECGQLQAEVIAYASDPRSCAPLRHCRHRPATVATNAVKLRALKHLQRGEIPWISHPLQLVETPGLEPGSAVA